MEPKEDDEALRPIAAIITTLLARLRANAERARGAVTETPDGRRGDIAPQAQQERSAPGADVPASSLYPAASLRHQK